MKAKFHFFSPFLLSLEEKAKRIVFTDTAVAKLRTNLTAATVTTVATPVVLVTRVGGLKKKSSQFPFPIK